MTALLVCITLFAGYLVIGLGVTAALPRSFSALTRLRLAPGLGISLFVTAAISLSRAGWPVASFTPVLTTLLLAASTAAIILRPPRLEWKDAFAFVVPILIGLLFVGSPLASFGFHWLSFSNDDMTNYSLSAQRFAESGYYTPPPVSTTLGNHDIAQYYWGLSAIVGERVGADILLASASTIFGHNTFEIFMPFIVSGFLVVVAAAGALGLPNGSRLLGTCISTAVAAAPLSGFGVFYQLLAQEFGLATSVTLAPLALAPLDRFRSRNDVIRICVVAAVVASGLIAIYPEMLPFVLLGAAISFGARARRLDFRAVVGAAGTALLFVFVLLNAQVVTMLRLVVNRVLFETNRDSNVTTTAFPYYLIPSGIANLWGLQPIAAFYSDPLQSVLIAFGLALTVAAVVFAIILVRRTETPAAPILCGMAVFAVFAAWRRESFGLYKLAMYVQPFLIATVLSALAFLVGRRTWRRHAVRATALVTGAAVFIAMGVPTAFVYRNVSSDKSARAGFVEIPVASRDAILRQVADLAEHTHGSVVLSDTPNVSLGKVEAGYFRDDGLFFVSRDYFSGSIRKPTISPFTGNGYLQRLIGAEAIARQRGRYFEPARFDYNPGGTPKFGSFRVDTRLRDYSGERSHAYLLASTERQTVINRRIRSPKGRDLIVIPFSRAADRLEFVETDIGGAAAARGHSDVSLYQLEGDYYFPGRTMAAAGRYMLFRVEDLHEPIRLTLDVSATLSGGHSKLVPLATAVGTRRASFHAVGRGSARLVSDPIVPQIVHGVPYVGIDMGTDGAYFPNGRTGLMRLYGRDIRADSRHVIGFVRDISALPADFSPRDVPTAIRSFPRDLANPDLFYSGIYEDGWMGGDARVLVTSAKTTGALSLRLLVPLIADGSFAPSVTVSVDGTPCGTWPASLGRSTIDVPFYGALGPHTVELHFSRTQHMPAPDLRAVSAKIQYLGFR